jgi:spore germination protein YaaH
MLLFVQAQAAAAAAQETKAAAARAKAAIDAGTAGIAIWALGYETPETWARLQNLAP